MADCRFGYDLSLSSFGKRLPGLAKAALRVSATVCCCASQRRCSRGGGVTPRPRPRRWPSESNSVLEPEAACDDVIDVRRDFLSKISAAATMVI